VHESETALSRQLEGLGKIQPVLHLTGHPDLGQIAGDAELQQGPDREATVEEPLDVQVHGERGSVVGVAQEPERRTARPRARSRLSRLGISSAARGSERDSQSSNQHPPGGCFPSRHARLLVMGASLHPDEV